MENRRKMQQAVKLHTSFDSAALLLDWGRLWKVAGLESSVSVEFSRRMSSSLGRCYPKDGTIRIAAWLCEDRGDDGALLTEVLCHEAAHVAVYRLYGKSVRPHGPQWKRLMRAAGFEPRVRFPAEILPQSVLQRRRRRQRWRHSCPVCEHSWTAGRVMRRWRCRSCVEAGREGGLRIERHPAPIHGEAASPQATP